MKGTNFKSISIIRDIKRDGIYDVVIYVGAVKMATFSCPESSLMDIIKSNLQV